MKRVAVVVCAREREKITEALRAAVGLTLRGARVSLVRDEVWPDDEKIRRALGTLEALGHDVRGGAAALDAADVVEVWS